MTENPADDAILLQLKSRLSEQERDRFSPGATLSEAGVRRFPEDRTGHRQPFAVDTDRILHSKAYARYIDKTQVFYLVDNDHITHRVLHVQLVSRIGRTAGRFLGLNEDLIEAIALGHDIGHPPFGHDGEKILDAICRDHGLPGFQHNVQSVFALEHLEKKGRGINLCLQTLDGILCHDGEIHNQYLAPRCKKTFSQYDEDLRNKEQDKDFPLFPMTIEGCLVRLADTIGYVGRDIEDAIDLQLIDRHDLPANCQDMLGNTNGTIVYRLVTDLIKNSSGQDAVGFSPEMSASLKELKKFNYDWIYFNPRIKKGFEQIRNCYQALFRSYLGELKNERKSSAVFVHFLDSMTADYRERFSHPALVKDFMAGMTDEFFLRQARDAGFSVPERVTP